MSYTKKKPATSGFRHGETDIVALLGYEASQFTGTIRCFGISFRSLPHGWDRINIPRRRIIPTILRSVTVQKELQEEASRPNGHSSTCPDVLRDPRKAAERVGAPGGGEGHPSMSGPARRKERKQSIERRRQDGRWPKCRQHDKPLPNYI